MKTEFVYSHLCRAAATEKLSPLSMGKTQQNSSSNYKWILIYFKSHPSDALDRHPKGVFLDRDAVGNGGRYSCGTAVGVMNKPSQSGDLIVVTCPLNISVKV